MITLILGGARSGKSNYAQNIAITNALPVVYLATGIAMDDEMAKRIVHHKQSRPSDWRVRECPLNLIDVIIEESKCEQTILVDCLTLWLNNQLHHYPNQDFSALMNDLILASKNTAANIIFVANEVGLGVIPLGEISRKFVDEAGRLNQGLAQAAHEVVFIAAGLPLILKQSGSSNG